jgi:ATP-dependent exoDNAse (exonuclease V) alpha subunit
MAVYRFEAKIIGRSKGRSATASAAYRAAERIEDARTGICFDYTRYRGVLHSEILTPAGTPEWMRDRAQLWNAVEAVEKRKDAQLARDLVLSLPHELTHDQRLTLVREFLREEFVAKGMIADFAIHKPDREGDQRNHHAHVMLTMRELTGDGFGKKVRDWNEPEQLERWRERWADCINRNLEKHGHQARVDHRSLADQGLDREPEPKQGPVATEMERAGRSSHAGADRRAAKARNRQRAELETELSAISAEIIDLEAERRWRAGAEEDEQRERSNKPVPRITTDAGMVAQQAEALRRFRRNSERLERQRQDRDRDLPAPAPGQSRDAQEKDAERQARLETFKQTLDRRTGEKSQDQARAEDTADRAGETPEAPPKSGIESLREKLGRQRQDRERDKSATTRSRDRDPER